MLLHFFLLDVHSQLRTMDDGWHGFLPYAKALFSTSDERLEINEDIFLLLTTDDTDETVSFFTQRRKGRKGDLITHCS